MRHDADRQSDPGAAPVRERTQSSTIVEIRTTFGDRAAAEACAARLVNDRLAACAQVDGPITSTYRWRGAVETAAEWRCICKTTPARAGDCRAALVAGHSYELPEIVESRVEAAPAYAAWVRESVGDTGPP